MIYMILKINKEINKNLKPGVLKVIKENLPYYFPNLNFRKISKSLIVFDLKKNIKKKILKKNY